MSELIIDNLWKRFGGNEVLRGLDLAVDAGDIVGLIAVNGAGKTTMINLLFGVYPKDKGRALFQGRELPQSPEGVVSKGLARTFQNARLSTNMTVAEVVRAVLTNRFCSWKHYLSGRKTPDSILSMERELLSQLGLTTFADSNAGTLPFGLQRKVDLARAIATGAKFLFLDEPAAGLSESEEQELAQYLRDLRDLYGFTFVIIDHRITFLRRIVDRLVFLHDGKIESDSSSGSVDTVLQSSTLRLHYFGDSDDPISPGRCLPVSDPLRSAPQPAAQSPLAVANLTVDRDRMPVVRSASYSCTASSLSAIVGPNGAGKSSLLECMAGIIPPTSGIVTVNGVEIEPMRLLSDRSIALVPETTDVFPGLTVEENLRLGLTSVARSLWPQALRSIAVEYPLLATQRRQSASVLSGGERRMLALARAMIGELRVLLVDEPSAGLAPTFVNKTYRKLRELSRKGSAVVVADSQAAFSEHYADRLNSMARGELTDFRTQESACASLKKPNETQEQI
jgi:branched-chain amino acid transport system ATP-binding protein